MTGRRYEVIWKRKRRKAALAQEKGKKKRGSSSKSKRSEIRQKVRLKCGGRARRESQLLLHTTSGGAFLVVGLISTGYRASLLLYSFVLLRCRQ